MAFSTVICSMVAVHAGQEEEQEIHPRDGVQQRAQGDLRAQQL